MLSSTVIADARGEEPRPEPNEPAESFVVRSAVAKLGVVRRTPSYGWLVAADTVVVSDGRILGKPTTDYEARHMLTSLRNRWHEVTTGVAVADVRDGSVRTGVETSRILTRDYSDYAIEAYVGSREPFDKAGAYAVQDQFFKPVVSVEGCYLNVVGLPLCVAVNLLSEAGAQPQLRPFSQIPYYSLCKRCKLRDHPEVTN